MAKNALSTNKDGSSRGRIGAIKNRSQAYNDLTKQWVKFDENHKIMGTSNNKFANVAVRKPKSKS